MEQGPSANPMKQGLTGASRSQALVEFVLSLPLLLAMLFAIIDFALLFSAWLITQNMAHQTVRYAVTGQYNPAYCTAGCVSDADLDQARIKSIHDVANTLRGGLLYNSLSTILQPGFLQVVVCSSAPGFSVGFGQTATTIYGSCSPGEDAGGPNDVVEILVDYNNPFITPFLNQIWPMVHLSARDQGLNEEFRISRKSLSYNPVSSNTPQDTDTPTDTSPFTPTTTGTSTNTPTPTNTPTVTLTPTITATPDCSQYYFSTNFLLVTWGPGAPSVRIQLTSGSLQDTYVQLMTLDWSAYEGADPSQVGEYTYYDNKLISSTPYPSSPYTWVLVGPPTDVMLLAGRSVYIEYDFQNLDGLWPADAYSQSFGLTVDLANGCTVTYTAQPTPTPTITPTPSNTATPTSSATATNTATITETPTITNTPTATPLPSSTPTATATGNCALISVSAINDLTNGWFDVWVTNNNPVPIHLTQSVVTWSFGHPGQQLLDEWFNGVQFYSGPAANSPLTLNPAPIAEPATSIAVFLGYFTNVSGALYGNMSVNLTFDHACTANAGLSAPTPTPTNTYTPSNTPTPSYTPTITNTPTITSTPTNTNTPTKTFTPSNTPVPPTSTYTYTPSFTPTMTYTPTQSPTKTLTPTPHPPTSTFTQTPSTTPTPTNTVCFDC